jgi:hypothetical protein
LIPGSGEASRPVAVTDAASRLRAPPRYLIVREAAIRQWRRLGKGTAHIKVGNKVVRTFLRGERTNENPVPDFGATATTSPRRKGARTSPLKACNSRVMRSPEVFSTVAVVISLATFLTLRLPKRRLGGARHDSGTREETGV